LVKELVRYLIENMFLDFQGDISVERVREFLREDDSREARQLLSKIIEEKGVDDHGVPVGRTPAADDHARLGQPGGLDGSGADGAHE